MAKRSSKRAWPRLGTAARPTDRDRDPASSPLLSLPAVKLGHRRACAGTPSPSPLGQMFTLLFSSTPLHLALAAADFSCEIVLIFGCRVAFKDLGIAVRGVELLMFYRVSHGSLLFLQAQGCQAQARNGLKSRACLVSNPSLWRVCATPMEHFGDPSFCMGAGCYVLVLCAVARQCVGGRQASAACTSCCRGSRQYHPQPGEAQRRWHGKHHGSERKRGRKGAVGRSEAHFLSLQQQ